MYRITVEESTPRDAIHLDGPVVLSGGDSFRELYRRTVDHLDMDALIIAVDGLDKVQE